MAHLAAHALDQVGGEVAALGERLTEPLAEGGGEGVDLADGRAAVPVHE
jgi:hypothetical protein